MLVCHSRPSLRASWLYGSLAFKLTTMLVYSFPRIEKSRPRQRQALGMLAVIFASDHIQHAVRVGLIEHAIMQAQRAIAEHHDLFRRRTRRQPAEANGAAQRWLHVRMKRIQWLK